MGYVTDIETLYRVHLDRRPDRPGFHEWTAHFAFETVKQGASATAQIGVMNSIESFFFGVNEAGANVESATDSDLVIAEFKAGLDQIEAAAEALLALDNAAGS